MKKIACPLALVSLLVLLGADLIDSKGARVIPRIAGKARAPRLQYGQFCPILSRFWKLVVGLLLLKPCQ